jgi:exodeoxyribonuclease-3
MNIYSWNVNGIRACYKKGFMDWLRAANPDILCLQEVRAEVEQIPDEIRDISDYHAFWNPAERKGYSGTGILTRTEPEAVNYGFGDPEFDSEGRVIQLEFDTWVLNGIYFPNGAASEDRLDYKLRFYDAFLENSLEWMRKGKNVITLGDYNTCHKEIDIARPKENAGVSGFLPIERAWMDKYVENGFVDTFRTLHPTVAQKYTWWSNRGGARANNVGWRIDYCFVNEALMEKVTAAAIHDQDLGSDHCPISIAINI